MSDVKSIIGILCKYLNLLLEKNYKPEQFRLAKFNKNSNNLIEELWTLLYLLLKDNFTYAFVKNETLVSCVKLQFCYLKYNNLHFYSLPEDMSYGSRELLLAFGWLLASENILFRLTNQRIRNSLISLEYDEDIKGILNDIELQKNIHLDKNKEENINYILWLAGNIQYNLNCIDITQEEKIKLIAKLHHATKNSSGLPHLSVAEVKYIKNPELLKDYLIKIEPICALLNIHTSWNKQSPKFWEWMESVLMEKYSSPSGDYMNCLDKNNLSQMVQKVRTKLLSLISCEGLLAEKNPQNGLNLASQPPRYLANTGNKENEVNAWLKQSEEQLIDINYQIEKIQNDLKGHLQKDQQKGAL